MAQVRYSTEQIIHKLREIDVIIAQGATVKGACRQAGYCIDWPSAAFIGSRLNRIRRTGKWYLRTIKSAGDLHCNRISNSNKTRNELVAHEEIPCLIP
ncbi:MAG: hypothetical protein COA78_10395 [Blastopirellula sp.]|nr:MAG: hypothetical protein COA78_10395 [Blastopirellula sp.]